MNNFLLMADTAANCADCTGTFSAVICNFLQKNQVGLLMLAVSVAVSIPVSIIVSWIVRGSIKIMLKKSKKEEDKISDSLNKPIIFAGILTGIVYGLRTITMPEAVINIVNRVYFVVIIFIVAWALLRMLSVMRLLLQEIAKKTENVYDDLLVSLIYPVLKCVIWVVLVLFVAENVFNFKVTALIAGAGVAAMAIAFAAQNTIANIFGALALISDRPFTISLFFIVYF